MAAIDLAEETKTLPQAKWRVNDPPTRWASSLIARNSDQVNLRKLAFHNSHDSRRDAMKRLCGLLMFVLFIVSSGGCTKAETEPATQIINPGDRVGDFLVTTDKDGDAYYPFDMQRSCSKLGSDETYSCKASVGNKINITTGLYDDSVRSETPTAKLNENWSSSNYTLFIEGVPVNLEAFGFVEKSHPVVGLIRFWDVVISTDKPGEITVRDSGTDGSEPFLSTTIYKYSTP